MRFPNRSSRSTREGRLRFMASPLLWAPVLGLIAGGALLAQFIPPQQWLSALSSLGSPKQPDPTADLPRVVRRNPSLAGAQLEDTAAKSPATSDPSLQDDELLRALAAGSAMPNQPLEPLDISLGQLGDVNSSNNGSDLSNSLLPLEVSPRTNSKTSDSQSLSRYTVPLNSTSSPTRSAITNRSGSSSTRLRQMYKPPSSSQTQPLGATPSTALSSSSSSDAIGNDFSSSPGSLPGSLASPDAAISPALPQSLPQYGPPRTTPTTRATSNGRANAEESNGYQIPPAFQTPSSRSESGRTGANRSF